MGPVWSDATPAKLPDEFCYFAGRSFFAMASLTEARTPKWEYLVVSAALNNRNLEQMLNARGLDGWELVGFTRKDVAVFKRAVK